MEQNLLSYYQNLMRQNRYSSNAIKEALLKIIMF